MAQLQSSTFTELTLPQGNSAQRPGSPANGMMRYNTDYNLMEYWDGTNWRPVTGYSHGTVGTGGDNISMLGGGVVHQFTSVTSATFTPNFTGYVQVLVVGGGGGANGGWGGGGGGGGLVFNRAYPVSQGVGIPLSVGGGGPSGSGQGGNSTFGSTTAYGGGYSGFWNQNTPGNAGGSGGGGANCDSDGNRMRCFGGAGTTGQGFPGGAGVRYNDDGENTHNGGGGGGAGGPGLASQDSNQKQATHGGPGAASDILGSILYWSGGGASGPHICDGGGGDGGIGGGGAGGAHYSPGTPSVGNGYGGSQALNNGGNASNSDGHSRFGGNGGANTGGGGGAAGSYHGTGGSGIVIVRY